MVNRKIRKALNSVIKDFGIKWYDPLFYDIIITFGEKRWKKTLFGWRELECI